MHSIKQGAAMTSQSFETQEHDEWIDDEREGSSLARRRRGMEEEADSPELMTAEVDPSSVAGGRGNSELPNDMAEWSPDEVAAYTALRSKRKKCCIGGCTHKSLPIARSYHQLPVRNKDVWVKWIEVVRWSRNEPDWTPNGEAAPLLCSRHFPDSDFISYEASSRVRLSHTAIPVYYVDPPEGTVMDPRFSEPLPIPPMLLGPRHKEKSKTGSKIKSETTMSTFSQFGDNMGYDIEEVTEENYDGRPEEELYNDNSNPLTAQFPFMSMNSLGSGVSNNISTVSTSIVRTTSVQSIGTNKTGSRNLKYANSASKPPALIRANFFPFRDNSTSHSQVPKLLDRGGVNVNIKKLRLSLPPLSSSPMMMKQKSPPTKHKIGLAKCRLIVQTLENQLKIAKTRLAEQLEVPYQVVNGVWNMRESLKDKL